MDNKRIRNGITREETWCKEIMIEMINFEHAMSLTGIEGFKDFSNLINK